jgi:cation diffusion facilitator CzcD-associated flavoprotein CzcO
VPAHLYSYSFHRYDWSRRYPPHGEILAYIDDVVATYDLARHLRYGFAVDRATFDEDAAVWTLTSRDGDRVRARVVVSSVGQLNRPRYPDIPGRDTFAGTSWHSARWDHSCDLTGKRVAVIGTGASAIQFVPEVAKQAAEVLVFQRNAPYVIPKADREYSRRDRTLFARMPWIEKLDRASIFARGELLTTAILGSDVARKNVEKMWRTHLDEQVTDPELRARCVPDFVVGCNRILFSNDWYPALASPHVELVTDAVTDIVPDGLVTEDEISGETRRHEVDVIIYGTGFGATGFLQPMEVIGRGGADLQGRWAHGAAAYRGVAVPEFPNFFMLYGPNTNLGGNSIISMLEAQVGYIARLLGEMRRLDLDTVDVRADQAEEFATWVAEQSRTTAWVTDCHSWYTTEGHNTNNWPDLTFRYHKLMARPDLFAYEVRPRRTALAGAVG